ncbi:MAG: hypothetical protein ACXU86_07905, partial [Archangium sp.]
MSRSAPREQEQSEPGGPGGVRDAEVARQLTRPMAPAAPMPARPSGSEWLAAWLKLGSALCALAAAGLFVRPLVRGEVSLQPRILTLQPTFSSPSEGPPASQELPPDTVTREQRADFDGAILM